MINIDYTSKIIVIDIQKIFKLLYHIRRLILLALNKVCDDFD